MCFAVLVALAPLLVLLDAYVLDRPRYYQSVSLYNMYNDSVIDLAAQKAAKDAFLATVYPIMGIIFGLCYVYLFYNGFSNFIDGHRASTYLFSVMSTEEGLALMKDDPNTTKLSYNDILTHFKRLALFNASVYGIFRKIWKRVHKQEKLESGKAQGVIASADYKAFQQDRSVAMSEKRVLAFAPALTIRNRTVGVKGFRGCVSSVWAGCGRCINGMFLDIRSPLVAFWILLIGGLVPALFYIIQVRQTLDFFGKKKGKFMIKFTCHLYLTVI